MNIDTIPLLINGEDVSTETTFDVVNPTSGKTVFQAYSANSKHAIAAIDAAAKAFSSWSRMQPLDRRALLYKAAQLLEERLEEAVELQQLETSVEKNFARKFQGYMSIEMLQEYAARTTTIEGNVPEIDKGTEFFFVGKDFNNRNHGTRIEGTLWRCCSDGSLECGPGTWFSSCLCPACLWEYSGVGLLLLKS